MFSEDHISLITSKTGSDVIHNKANLSGTTISLLLANALLEWDKNNATESFNDSDTVLYNVCVKATPEVKRAYSKLQSKMSLEFLKELNLL